LAHEDISELLKAGIQAAKDRKKAEARRLLEQVLEIDDSNEPAWMWLASVVDTPREKRICLENVLEINPNNVRAREALAALGPAPVAAPEPTRAVPQAAPTPQPQGTTAQVAPTIRRRRGLNPIVFIGGGILGIALIIVALLLAFNVIQVPVAVVSTAVPTATPATAANVTQATLPPNGILVTSDATLLPTFTPTYTNTPNPSSTPTPSLPQLTNYRVAYNDAKNVISTMLGDGSQKSTFFTDSRSTAGNLSISKSGKIAYVGIVTNHSQIFVADLTGQNPTAVTKFTDGEYVSSPCINVDGTKIAFVKAAPGEKEDPATREIEVINIDGSNLQQITSNGIEDRDPAWSPDGKQLAFASDYTGKKNMQIYISDASGQKPQQITSSTGNNYSPTWSPDGKSIAFVSTRDRYENIYIVEIANTLNTRILTYDGGESNSRSPDWSSDGVFITFASNRGGTGYHVYLMTPNAKFTQKIAGQDDKTDSLNPHFFPVQH